MSDGLKDFLRQRSDEIEVPSIDVGVVVAHGRARKLRVRVATASAIIVTVVAGLVAIRTWDVAWTSTDLGLAESRPSQPTIAELPEPHPASAALNRGDLNGARELGEEELPTPADRGHWDFGNRLHVGNLILGHVALREGNIDSAVSYLLEAGRTPGSPQLDSFGPNMTLARDLLLSGERKGVLKYLKLVDRFWDDRNSYLPQWRKFIRAGAMPDFGANLLYGQLTPAPIEQLGRCPGCALPKERR